MFKSGILSVWHNLLSILPKDELAAVLIIPFLCFFYLNLSTIAIAVKGFTVPEAAQCIGTSCVI